MSVFEREEIEKRVAKGYELKVYESDPYYHVEIFKDGVKVDDELLGNRKEELDELVKKYEKK